MLAKNCSHLRQLLQKNRRCSSGRVECVFDNPVECFLSKVRELSAQSPKTIKRTKKIQLKNFCTKDSSGKEEFIFNNTAVKFLAKIRKKIA